MYRGYVPGVISLQVIWDVIPQVAIVPLPLRTGTGTAVRPWYGIILFAFSYCIDTFFIIIQEPLFYHGVDFRKMS